MSKNVDIVRYTDNYGLFEMHAFNRPLRNNPALVASMRRHGFWRTKPLICRKNGRGLLNILEGHNRFNTAKQLGIGVWYQVDELAEDIPPAEREITSCRWNLSDYVHAYAAAGNTHYSTLLAFQKDHDLPITTAISLVGGQGARSNNFSKDVKAGTFRVGNMDHANEVVQITDMCAELGIDFARHHGFVAAVSAALRIPEFDADLFCRKVRLHGSKMGHRSRVGEYLEEIEEIYNYAARDTRLAVKFRAEEVARVRKRNGEGRFRR